VKFFVLLLAFSALLADLPLPKEAKIEFGFLKLRNKDDKEEAQIFYTVYTQPADNQKPRPLTFCVNGGPGAASVWLQLGGVGPLRLKNSYESAELEQNPGSILPFTDLVFLDPVSTGFSKSSTGVDPSLFHSFETDVDSLNRAIVQFLNTYERWDAPLFLMGESYGSLRVVGIAKKLFETTRIATRGIILVSGPLDYGTIIGESTHDMPYIAAFPTQAILEGLKKGKKAEDVRPEAENFLEKIYQPALFLGDALPEKEREPLADELSRWTGVPKEELMASFLRITSSTFRYMTSRGQTFGRFDGRVVVEAPYEIPPYIQIEPSFLSLMPHFQKAIHQVFKEYGWKSGDDIYVVLADSIKWDFKTNNCYLNVVASLKELLYQLPQLQVLSCNGYYDLGVPYYGVKHSLRHLLLDKKTATRVRQELFNGGHMFYLDRSVNESFGNILKTFYLQK